MASFTAPPSLQGSASLSGTWGRGAWDRAAVARKRRSRCRGVVRKSDNHGGWPLLPPLRRSKEAPRCLVGTFPSGGTVRAAPHVGVPPSLPSRRREVVRGPEWSQLCAGRAADGGLRALRRRSIPLDGRPASGRPDGGGSCQLHVNHHHHHHHHKGGTRHCGRGPLHVAAIDLRCTWSSSPGKFPHGMCVLQVLISPKNVRKLPGCRTTCAPDPQTRPISRGASTSTRAFTGGLWPAAHVSCAMHRSYAPMPSFGPSFRAIGREEHAEVVSTRVLRLHRRNNRAQFLTLLASCSHARPGGQGSDLEMCV